MVHLREIIHLRPFRGVTAGGGAGYDLTLNGLTYTVSDAFTDGGHGTGSHKHSSNIPADQVFPAIPTAIGMAEVGGFFGDETIRGISEFGLASVPSAADTAILKFDVVDLIAEGYSPEPVGGLYGQEGTGGSPGPYVGTIQVYGFIANGTEELGDYTTSATLLGTFSAAGLTAGQTVTFDLTTYFNARIAATNSHMGVRLQITPENTNASAITFENFRIDADKAGPVVVDNWIWRDSDNHAWRDADNAIFR